MRRWILLGILVMVVSLAGWRQFQLHRTNEKAKAEAAWLASYQRPIQAFYREDYGTAEKLFTEILPEAEKRYPPNDRYLADLLSMLGTSYRVEHKYEQAEPTLKRALQVFPVQIDAAYIGGIAVPQFPEWESSGKFSGVNRRA